MYSIKNSFVLFVLFVVASPLPAQHERYELGRRLRDFERVWEKQADPAARKRALAILPKASTQFLSFQLGEAGRTLDDATHALRSDKPRTDAEKWLAALSFRPSARLVDSETKKMTFTVEPFYKVKGGTPVGATADLRIGDGPIVPVPLDRFPVTVEVPFPENKPEGETDTRLIGNLNGQFSMLQSSTLSRIDYKKRVAALKESLASGKLDPTTQATLRDRLEFFHELAAGGSVETDFPVSRMLTHAEFIALGIKDRFTINPAATPFGGKGPGQPHEYWLTLALENKRTAPVRILLPNRPDAKTPRPIVVALHGAGGSENMFFDSYGAGQMWKDCLARGWILVATRSPELLSSPAVKEIVEKLAETYPIDKSKIFLVGHSMGAAQVVDLCQKHPGYFAGAAVLGGGGRVKDPKAFTTLPVFIGIGTQDFALKGAQNLKKALAESDAKRVTYKEYPDLEHLLIVREALPEVFKMFDGIVETKRN